MSKTNSKYTKRRVSGIFYPLPANLVNSSSFQTLSPMGLKVFMLILSQVRFKGGGTVNNGDLSATFTQAQAWGINSKATLRKAIDELLARGLIEQTRQVMFSATDKNRPNLYAITLWAVDECDGKVKATKAPSANWLHWQPEAVV
jgi:hypothetical protein